MYSQRQELGGNRDSAPYLSELTTQREENHNMSWFWIIAVLAAVGVATDLFYTSTTFFEARFNIAALGAFLVGQLFFVLYEIDKKIEALKVDNLRDSLEELKRGLEKAARSIEALESSDNPDIDPLDR
jgi:hypothetical protein